MVGSSSCGVMRPVVWGWGVLAELVQDVARFWVVVGERKTPHRVEMPINKAREVPAKIFSFLWEVFGVRLDMIWGFVVDWVKEILFFLLKKPLFCFTRILLLEKGRFETKKGNFIPLWYLL